MIPRGLLDHACEELHVKKPPTEEGVAEDGRQLQRDAQKLRTTLGIVDRKPKDQARCRGEHPSDVVAHRAPFDGPAEEPHPRTDDHVRFGMILRHAQERSQFLKRRCEIGIPKSNVRRLELKSVQKTMTHRFGLPLVPRKSENGECIGVLTTHALQPCGGSIRASVVDEEEAKAGKPRGKSNERGGVQPPLFVEARYNHHDRVRHILRRRCLVLRHSASIIIDMAANINGIHFSLDSLDALDATEDRHFWSVVKRRLIISLIRRYAQRTPRRIIDIGCGNGGLLHQLTNAFPDTSLTGVDGYQQALLHCHRRVPDTTLILKDILHLERLPASEPFDVAILADVLEHCDEPEQVLRSVRSILAKDGIVIATVPASMLLWSDRDVFLGHRKRYTRRELEKVVHRAGFQVLRSNYAFSYLYPPAVLFRKALAALRKQDGKAIEAAELRVVPVVNTLLKWLGSAENYVSRISPLPCGTSAYCVARARQAPQPPVYSRP